MLTKTRINSSEVKKIKKLYEEERTKLGYKKGQTKGGGWGRIRAFKKMSKLHGSRENKRYGQERTKLSDKKKDKRRGDGEE